jgi:hypothetical protein
VAFDRLPEEGEVPINGMSHRSAILFPAACTAFDIGEEEGDGATGKIDHRPAPNGSSADEFGMKLSHGACSDTGH